MIHFGDNLVTFAVGSVLCGAAREVVAIFRGKCREFAETAHELIVVAVSPATNVFSIGWRPFPLPSHLPMFAILDPGFLISGL